MIKEMMTIPEFCARMRIGRSTFYNLVNRRKAPRITYIGTKVFITEEAAEKWQKSNEQSE